MKRLLAANLQKNSKSRYDLERFNTMLQAQIHNMLDLGWDRKNIILLSLKNLILAPPAWTI